MCYTLSERVIYVLLIGIDGGGTKTELCLFSYDGTVISHGLFAASNPVDIGIDESFEVLSGAICMHFHGVSSVFAGVSGAGVADNNIVLASRLSCRFSVNVKVDTDAANVLSLSPDPDDSAIVICGTGSSVFVRKGVTIHRVGGWGYLFDGSGSGFDIGRDGISHALAVEDGLIPPDLLYERISSLLPGAAFDCISVLHEKGKPYIASFAKTVIQCAEEGDKASNDILLRSAKRLSVLMSAAVERYSAPRSFIAAGGILKSDYFRYICRRESGFELINPTLPPVFGACVEAMRAEGFRTDESFRKNFAESYERVGINA
ncbi:MAG: hypothetical protein GX633_02885 [Clostridiales bacterium]|nr:hypothetical protein [Clostridiales bacterium]